MNVLVIDGFFVVIFKKTFQETLLIPVYEVARINNTATINGGFRH